MIYINADSTDASFWFSLEKYVMESSRFPDGCFLFWTTAPTLMIGRYQNTLSEINRPYAESHGIRVVRRMTGGGTIYTDPGGWQYSFVVKKPTKTIDFASYTRPVTDALKSLGAPALLSGRNDIVIGEKKISGNAQYIGKNAVLHHGSLLFKTDLEAMVRALSVDDEKIVAKGIKSVRQRVTNIADHLPEPLDGPAFRDAMVSRLAAGMDTYALAPDDLERIDAIAAAQFRCWDWNFGKDPECNVTRAQRFAGGKITLKLRVENGLIANLRFYGDFFAAKDVSLLENALIACRYEKEDIKNALLKAHADDFFYQITADEILGLII